MACGIDPVRSLIFKQSSVSAHCELNWIFSCMTKYSQMLRMTQFKDKSVNKGESVSLSLLCYPVLMVADTLLYDVDIIPTGDDQLQHLELINDTASNFNRRFGVDLFKRIKPYHGEMGARVMSLEDGTKKMSKSNPSETSRIHLDDSDDMIVSKIKAAKTDSINNLTENIDNRPEVKNLLDIYSLVSDLTREDILSKFEGQGFGKFKLSLTDSLVEFIRPIRTKINDLIKNEDYLNDIIKESNIKANGIASKKLERIKEIVGL
jgi:tryptophanyl-tRNA synthetase